MDIPVGCPGQEVIGSMVRINGLFHLLINRAYWGEKTHLLTSWDIQVEDHPRT